MGNQGIAGAPFDEIVGLLHNLAPDVLALLRREYSEFSLYLDPGTIGGEAEVADEEKLRRLKIALACATLSRAHVLAEGVRVRLHRQIRVQGRVELALSLASIVVNAGLLVLVDRPALQGVAALALLFSLSLMGAHMLKLSVLSPIPLLEVYRRMGSSIRRARELLVELALCRHSADGARIDDVVQRANIVAAELNAESDGESAVARGIRPAGTQGVPARAIVHELLVALFSSYSELLRWISYHFADGSRLVTLLPAPGEADGALATVSMERAGEAVRVLMANGFVDLEFFEQLAANFPRRRADIDGALERWTIAIASHGDAEPGRL